MADYLLGIDYGTGGTKGCIIDTEGNLLGYAFREYPIISRHPSWSEHDPVLYWKSACEIVRACLAQSDVQPRDIRAIAVSSALPCMVMIDSAGDSVENAYNLMDRRATKEVAWVKEHIGERRVFEITGSRLDDHPALVNLLWERNYRPDSLKRIHKAVTIDGYIVFKLTGQVTLAHQNATFFGVAYDLRKKLFHSEILEQLEMSPSLLPELHYCDEIVGQVTAEAAEATGLAAGIPVAAGQADFNASCIASGVIDEGDIQSNLGTCGNFGIVHHKDDFMFEMIALAFTVDSRKNYVTIPTTTTGGMSLRFIRDTFGQAEKAAERSLEVDAYDLLTLAAEKAPPGSEGLIVLPFLMGERTPIWDVYARECVFGLSLNHTKGHFVRATMEGVAYAMYDSFRLIKEAGRRINTPIVMHEGGAKSRLWRQIITDMFDTPTVLTKRRTGAPFGDAVLAGVAVGLFRDYSMCKEWAEYVDRMEPSPENHELYLRYFALYKKLYEHIREDYRELARLRDGT